LGNDSGYKFAVGSSTDYLKFDGTNVLISGTLNANNIMIGKNVNGLGNSGFFIDSNNYWYKNSAVSFKIGDVDSYIQWSSPTLTVQRYN